MMNEDTRSIAERTTRSEYFDWIEWRGGERWSGQRNAQKLFEITQINDRLFILEMPMLSSARSWPCESLEAAKEQADKEFADWAHTLGLKLGQEWWKDWGES